MKKTLWILLIVALLASAGCAATEPQETTAPPPIEVQVPYEEPVRALRYAGIRLSVQSMWQQEDPQARLLLEAAAIFENQTGAVVTILWPGEHAATLENARGVDVFQLSAADFTAMPAEYAMDLTEMAAAAGYDAKSHETLRQQIIDQCGYLGAIAQVPYLGGIYYNADVFAQCGIEEVPHTWEEFLDLCALLRECGWQPLTMDKGDTLTAMELHLRRSIGTDEIRRMMGKDGHWNTDLPAIAALDQVVLFVQAGNMAAGTPAELTAGQNKMALSNSAMMVGTNGDCADVEEATLMDLNWGMFPYPGSMGSGTYMTADVLVIHRDSAHGQAAFDFALLLSTGEFDQLRADMTDGIPADPANASPMIGAMEAIEEAQPEPLTFFDSKQLDTAVKLWSGRYEKGARYASLLELSK